MSNKKLMSHEEIALEFAQANDELFLKEIQNNGDEIIVQDMHGNKHTFYKWNNEILDYGALAERICECGGVY